MLKFLQIVPNIKMPLPFCVLLPTLEVCMKHNFIPILLVFAGAVMAFHYKKIISLYGGCSMVVSSGPSVTGKTTAIKVSISLFGCCNNNMFVKCTNRGFLERSSMSTLPYGIHR